MSLGANLEALIKSIDGLGDVALFPRHLPPRPPASCVVWRLMPSAPVRCHSGDFGPRRDRVQLACVAQTYGAADELGRTIAAALEGYKGPMGDARACPIFVTSVTDNSEPELGTFAFIVDLTVWHRE